jgi:uncharacterized MnhB-related membrane protein
MHISTLRNKIKIIILIIVIIIIVIVSISIIIVISRQSVEKIYVSLTLSLLMSYIYGALCKARNFNVVYVWTYAWQR